MWLGTPAPACTSSPCAGSTPPTPSRAPKTATPHPRTPEKKQGAECETVKRKRRMLGEEGVAFDGERVARHCVVRAQELQKLAASK